MSINLVETECQSAVTRANTWLFTALILASTPAACGSGDASSNDQAEEFGPAVELNAQATDGPSSNGAVDMLGDLIEIAVLGFLSIVWIILRTLICFAATGWIGVVVLVAAFLGAAGYYLRYRILRDDWHKALAVGVIASLPVLIVRVLC